MSYCINTRKNLIPIAGFLFVLTGCASVDYITPTTGDLAKLNFTYPPTVKKLIIYDGYEKCTGWKEIPFEPNETEKEVIVRKNQKVSFTVNFVTGYSYGSFYSCRQTFTLDTVQSEYYFESKVINGVCNLSGYSLSNGKKVPAILQERKHVDPAFESVSAPHCKDI